MIVAITGTPASGKTSVAERVSSMLGWRLVKLNEFAEERDLYTGFDEKRDCKIVDIEKIKRELSGIDEENLIMESHYAHEIPSDVVFVMRVNPRELRKRGKEKGWKEGKTEENVEAEIMGICLQEAMEAGQKVIEIDTTDREPEDVAGDIVKRIKGLEG
jgi:adenylate kinase